MLCTPVPPLGTRKDTQRKKAGRKANGLLLIFGTLAIGIPFANVASFSNSIWMASVTVIAELIFGDIINDKFPAVMILLYLLGLFVIFIGENQGPAPVKLAVSKTPTSRSRWPEEPVPYGHPNIDISIDEETIVSRQHGGRNRPKVQFNFENKEDALKIMDRKLQESIYLVQVGEGDLEGSEVGSGVFQVLPVKKHLTEWKLKYSAVTACFELTKPVQMGRGKPSRLQWENEPLLRKVCKKICG